MDLGRHHALDAYATVVASASTFFFALTFAVTLPPVGKEHRKEVWHGRVRL